MSLRSKFYYGAAVILAGVLVGLGIGRFAGRVNPVDSVAFVTNEKGVSGGTGFHVKGPSGLTYLVTNGHVCGGVGEDGIVYVRRLGSDEVVPRRIIRESQTTDLCIVEPLPQAKALEIASEDAQSDTKLEAFGHPRLFPITHTDGRAIAEMVVMVLQGFNPKPGECDLPKHVRSEIDVLFWKIPVCLLKIRAIQTTVTILPGSSGSPILDKYGKVRGVAFAADDSNWAAMVPASDLLEFLQNY